MSSDTIRVSPINSDLLLVSANYLSAPAGVPLTPRVWRQGSSSTSFGRSAAPNLCPPNQWGRAAEWSRDSLQVFFAGMDSSHRSGIYRVFWDGHRSAALAHGQQLRSGAVTPSALRSSVISPLPDTSQTLDFDPPTTAFLWHTRYCEY